MKALIEAESDFYVRHGRYPDYSPEGVFEEIANLLGDAAEDVPTGGVADVEKLARRTQEGWL